MAVIATNLASSYWSM